MTHFEFPTQECTGMPSLLVETLTPREMDVLRGIATGMSNAVGNQTISCRERTIVT